MGEAVVEALGVSKRLGGRLVLSSVSLRLERGSVLAIVGPNGAGKTTLLKILAGLLEPDEGRVERAGRVSYLPQEDLLLPWLTLEDNIALPLRLRGASIRDARRAARLAAEAVGLPREALRLLPRHASGGTRRKAAIARALVTDPDALLLDEPTTGLDLESQLALLDAVKRLSRERAVALVTHQPLDIAEAATSVAVLAGRPGRLAAYRSLEGLTPEEKLVEARRLMLEAARI